MKCVQCGADNPDNSSFCERCGTPLLNSGLQTLPHDPTAFPHAIPVQPIQSSSVIQPVLPAQPARSKKKKVPLIAIFITLAIAALMLVGWLIFSFINARESSEPNEAFESNRVNVVETIDAPLNLEEWNEEHSDFSFVFELEWENLRERFSANRELNPKPKYSIREDNLIFVLKLSSYQDPTDSPSAAGPSQDELLDTIDNRAFKRLSDDVTEFIEDIQKITGLETITVSIEIQDENGDAFAQASYGQNGLIDSSVEEGSRSNTRQSSVSDSGQSSQANDNSSQQTLEDLWNSIPDADLLEANYADSIERQSGGLVSDFSFDIKGNNFKMIFSLDVNPSNIPQSLRSQLEQFSNPDSLSASNIADLTSLVKDLQEQTGCQGIVFTLEILYRNGEKFSSISFDEKGLVDYQYTVQTAFGFNARHYIHA